MLESSELCWTEITTHPPSNTESKSKPFVDAATILECSHILSETLSRFPPPLHLCSPWCSILLSTHSYPQASVIMECVTVVFCQRSLNRWEVSETHFQISILHVNYFIVWFLYFCNNLMWKRRAYSILTNSKLEYLMNTALELLEILQLPKNGVKLNVFMFSIKNNI